MESGERKQTGDVRGAASIQHTIARHRGEGGTSTETHTTEHRQRSSYTFGYTVTGIQASCVVSLVCTLLYEDGWYDAIYDDDHDDVAGRCNADTSIDTSIGTDTDTRPLLHREHRKS